MLLCDCKSGAHTCKYQGLNARCVIADQIVWLEGRVLLARPLDEAPRHCPSFPSITIHDLLGCPPK